MCIYFGGPNEEDTGHLPMLAGTPWTLAYVGMRDGWLTKDHTEW